MNINTLLVALAMLLSSVAVGQEFNQKDEQGRKQGPWKKFHVDSDQPFYIGAFKDDVAVGVFTYFYKDGKTKGLMDYTKKIGQCYAQIFHPNGSKMAVGKYVGPEKKDSTWVYYSPSGVLTAEDNWKDGVLHGKAVSYFPDNSTAELIHWEDGKKNGIWKQYFSSGKLMVEGAYQEDEYEGQMTFYFPTGKKEVAGKYVNGLRDGSWFYYNEDGSVHLQSLYSRGKILKEKKNTGVFQEHTEDGILISELTYLKGLKHGPFKIYHDGASWSVESVYDETIGESLDKRVVVGHQIQMSGKYKDDRLDGKIKYYNKAGILVKEEQYEAGELLK